MWIRSFLLKRSLRSTQLQTIDYSHKYISVWISHHFITSFRHDHNYLNSLDWLFLAKMKWDKGPPEKAPSIDRANVNNGKVRPSAPPPIACLYSGGIFLMNDCSALNYHGLNLRVFGEDLQGKFPWWVSYEKETIWPISEPPPPLDIVCPFLTPSLNHIVWYTKPKTSLIKTKDESEVNFVVLLSNMHQSVPLVFYQKYQGDRSIGSNFGTCALGWT